MNRRMIFDTPAYMHEISAFKRVMGLTTFREAEEILYPVRARKRQLQIMERRALEATTIKKH